MLLKNLIRAHLKEDIRNIDIKNLSLDSRKVKKGDLFFSLKGKKLHGDKFINEAIKKGARAVICSRKTKIQVEKIPVIKLNHPREALTFACKKFFRNKPKNIIAVTGTNGKSSVADFFYQILKKNNRSVASIGTLGVKRKNSIKKTSLTSPDIISLHKELQNLKRLGINNVIIEASSHGLAQGRLNGIDFKAGVFTNFSQDHLDYHYSMKNYFRAKMTLFSKLLKKNKNVIIDEKIKEFSKIKQICLNNKLRILKINNDLLWDISKIELIGKFQYKNLMMSVLAAKACNLSLKEINSVLHKIKSVNGRLENVRNLPNKSKVFVDFAHTPDALLTVAKALKENCKNRLSLVFGCGGERDKKKRKKMGKIAQKYFDKIYVTDDNPRNENPKKIRKEITRQLVKKSYFEIGNRYKAINFAIQNSSPHELILIAGKGHETTQDYGNKIINISDKEIIKNIKFKGKKINNIQYSKYLNAEILRKMKLSKKQNYFLGVSINSKQIKKNNLFVAIKGKNKDGHNFTHQALNKGANLCIVSKIKKGKNKRKHLKVRNTRTFLRQLAFLKRNESDAKIIAITGSSGKTTLKTLIAKTLHKFNPTHYSPKSFNNHYGVPLSLSNLEHKHSFGVFEIGMSKEGEINNLSKLVKPDIGIITNVAEAHIENFKNLNGIAKAKGEIIPNINKGGTLIANKDDKYFKYFQKKAFKNNIKINSFGISSNSDVKLLKIRKIKGENILKIRVFKNILFFKTKETSNSNILNILCCLTLLKNLNLNLNKVKNVFKNLNSLSGRGKIHVVERFKKKFKLLDESYNANPLSVKNAILNLSNIKKDKQKKYLLLGDMLELGKKSDYYHKNLSKIINRTDIDKLFVYGEKALKTYKYTMVNKRGNVLQNKKDFDDIFSKIIQNKDFLMIKGSNATGLNKISHNIIKGSTNAF